MNQSLIIWLISQAYAAETSFTLSLKLFLIKFFHTPLILPLSLWTEWSIEQCAKLAALLHQGHSFRFFVTSFFLHHSSHQCTFFVAFSKRKKKMQKRKWNLHYDGATRTVSSLPPSYFAISLSPPLSLSHFSIYPPLWVNYALWVEGRGCFACSCLQRWSIVTATHHSWFYCALFHDVSWTTTSRAGSVCQGGHINWTGSFNLGAVLHTSFNMVPLRNPC